LLDKKKKSEGLSEKDEREEISRIINANLDLRTELSKIEVMVPQRIISK
jgi:hypothetical protein